MNSIKTLYKLMEVSSRDLEIPDAYQRKLNTERVAKIVAGFNERMCVSMKSEISSSLIMFPADSRSFWRNTDCAECAITI